MRAGAVRTRGQGAQLNEVAQSQLRLIWAEGGERSPAQAEEHESAPALSLAALLGGLQQGSRCPVCGRGFLRSKSAGARDSGLEIRAHVQADTGLRCDCCGTQVERL